MKFHLTGFEHSTVFKFGNKHAPPMLDFEAWEWTVYGDSARNYGDESGHEITLRIQKSLVWKPRSDKYIDQWDIILDEKPEGTKPRNKHNTFYTDATDRPLTRTGALRMANKLLAERGVDIKVGFSAPKG